jgi:REP element-mobilizing transposase RayT
MPNHVHLIAQSDGNETLSEILRDLKKITSRKISKKLEIENSNEGNIILNVFKKSGENLKRIKNYKVWQDDNRPMVLYSNKFIWQKLDYIHNNPIKAGIVEKAEEYLFSSARNYAELESVLHAELLTREMKTVR